MSGGRHPRIGIPWSGGGEPVLLIGSLATPPDTVTTNANQLFYMGHAAQASGQVAKAYFYQLETGGPSVHIGIWSATGTLLGVSPAISPNAEGAWTSVDWSGGPSLTQGTTYIIGAVSTGYMVLGRDDTTPILPCGYPATMTYGAEGNFSPDPFTQSYGDLSIYVTT